VGGHTRAALRRTAKYGDCWHTTRQTPEFVAGNIPYLKRRVEREGRDPASVTVSLKRSLHFTDIGLPESGEVRSGGALVATTQDVIDDLQACHEIGIDQLTYDFRVTEIDDCVRVMERLAETVLPVARRLG
jgi:alkanesulfonate monooxygenase SsuD/methylene tetrahydromethanopterin reductase-like flavin-dependent oxidoreductase (luciferase family)